MWLKAASSNNNPRYISSFYTQCVRSIDGRSDFLKELALWCVKISIAGCPQVLRTDAGTENSLLAVIQPMLRHEHSDCFYQERSHIYGRSTSNQVNWEIANNHTVSDNIIFQKIEAWWSQLRKRHMEWWITFLKVHRLYNTLLYNFFI